MEELLHHRLLQMYFSNTSQGNKNPQELIIRLQPLMIYIITKINRLK
jgi:hypothetical protein